MFNVTINGAQVLTNFDILAAAGAKNKATIPEFAVKASTIGQVIISFTTVKDNAKCSGIEISLPSPSVPGGLAATANNTQVTLTWTAVSDATSYIIKRTIDADGGYTILSDALTNTTFLDTNVDEWTTYRYVVAAVSSGGISGDSTNICATPFQSFAEWQVKYFGGTNVAAAGPGADPFGTGQNNWFKYTAGLNPTNPESLFDFQVAVKSNLSNLNFGPTAKGRTYTVLSTSNLTTGIWIPVAGFCSPITNGVQAIFTDTNPVGTIRFYRVGIALP